APMVFKAPQPKREARYLGGTIPDIARELTTPYWDQGGVATMYHADHILEAQLGGSNDIDNLQLLDETSNTSSGSLIDKNILDKAQAFVTATKGKYSPREIMTKC